MKFRFEIKHSSYLWTEKYSGIKNDYKQLQLIKQIKHQQTKNNSFLYNFRF